MTRVTTGAGAPARVEADADAPSVIGTLPTAFATFEYEGYKYLKDAGGGYAFRYANARKKRSADIYVYPVAEENRELAHAQLVLGSTRATIEAIGAAVAEGVYANFDVVGAATQSKGLRTTARVQATYLRRNLASYTLVYQTEHDGTLVKIRVTMPDNESNRVNGEWDTFSDRMFALVIDSLPTVEPKLEAASEAPLARASGV